MKATAHWLELKGHIRAEARRPISTRSFSEQVFRTGKIEEGRVLRTFCKRTGQPV